MSDLADLTATDNQRLGRLGERLAVQQLQRDGWQILDRNWRCRAGEIDIVASERDRIVVCEVKTRLSVSAGTPVESMTARKARRLRGLAGEWMTQQGRHPDDARIDLIGVTIATDGTPTLRHVRGVA